MTYYLFNKDLVCLEMVKRFSKEDNFKPFEGGRDEWQNAEGRFSIIVDDNEYTYKTIRERDFVFDDVLGKLQASGNQVWTDKAALSNLI